MTGLRFAHVTMDYRHGEGRLPVLDGVDLEVAEGEFVCLLGPSGCGKSTLLHLASGLRQPQQGRITWAGKEVRGPGLDRAVVFQDHSLFPWLTARDNLEFALRAAGVPWTERGGLADRHLEIVGLEAYGDFYPRQLSGGMQQRLALARAFVLDAPLLLLDEPFGSVDALTRIYLQDLLLLLWSQHRKTVLLVTHDVDEALLLADRVVVMTPRPCKVKEEHRVPFPRPRRRDRVSVSLSYQSLRLELLQHLQEELLEELAAQRGLAEAVWGEMREGPKNDGDAYQI